MTLKRVAAGTSIILKQVIEGLPGKQGKPGKDGVTTTIEKVVHVHEEGKQGDTGAIPEHEVRNGEIRFKNPDGTWGKWVEVLPSRGGGGLASAVNYVLIAQAKYHVNRSTLIEGNNIFGVNYPGDVEIILPNGISKNILITFKDESNNAGVNNITITTENP